MRWRAALLALVVARSAAAADVWERAADPLRARADAAHLEAERLLLEAAEVRRHDRRVARALDERARSRLEGAIALGCDEPRLAFDLGRVLVHLGDDARAVAVLEAALAAAPDAPAAVDARFDLGVSYARLGRPDDEIAAYDAYLQRETDPNARAIAFGNRAEAHMLLGRLAAAEADDRAALALEPSEPLARWGLAVALDRMGRSDEAQVEVARAVAYDPGDQRLSSPAVFFLPPYDRYWYEALGAAQRARESDEPDVARLLREAALAKWDAYLAAAPADGRWVPLARAHRASAARDIARGAQPSSLLFPCFIGKFSYRRS